MSLTSITIIILVALNVLYLFGKFCLKKQISYDFLNVLIVSVLVGVTAFYAEETNKMASLMNKANQVNLRPYLTIRGKDIFYDKDGKIIFPINLINVGNSPARNVRIHHKLFKNEECIKKFVDPEDSKLVVFPREEPPLSHNEDIGKYVLKREELNDKYFRVQFVVTYDGYESIDNRTFYTLVDFKFIPLGYTIINGIEANQFNVIRPLSNEGFIKDDEFIDKMDICKDFNEL